MMFEAGCVVCCRRVVLRFVMILFSLFALCATAVLDTSSASENGICFASFSLFPGCLPYSLEESCHEILQKNPI